MSESINVKELLPQPEGDQVLHLRQLNAKLQKENEKLHEALGSKREFVDQVCGAIAAQEPYPRYQYKSPPRSGSLIVPVLEFSDWHIGEVIQANEVEGFNRFNWDIAQAGVFGIVTDFLQWVEHKRAIYRIETCAVVCKGDYISGDIHDELRVTAEFPTPVQTARAGALMGEAFRILCGHFKEVVAVEVGADNHGRLTRKPPGKQKLQNNFSFLVQYIANAAAGRCKNFRPIVAEGMKLVQDINGRKFLVEHGDTIKSHMGFPWYSLSRTLGREAMRRMNTSRGFHYYSIAHFHTPNLIEGRTIVNGSLSGTSEFDHSCGRHAAPCQVSYLVHPKHGVFDFTPWVRRDVK